MGTAMMGKTVGELLDLLEGHVENKEATGE